MRALARNTQCRKCGAAPAGHAGFGGEPRGELCEPGGRHWFFAGAAICYAIIHDCFSIMIGVVNIMHNYQTTNLLHDLLVISHCRGSTRTCACTPRDACSRLQARPVRRPHPHSDPECTLYICSMSAIVFTAHAHPILYCV